MPSPLHDTLNELFQERPGLAVEIIRDLLDVDVPKDVPVRLESNDFNDRPSKDFRPDTVISVGPAQAPVHGIVVEIQQEKNQAKRRQLPRYAATLWLSLRCPVTVLCICPKAVSAAWYAEPFPTGLPGYVFQAAVLGPRDIPAIKDPEDAAARPDLAAMAVMVHGQERPVTEAFMAAMKLVKPEHARQYYEYAYNMAADEIRVILEEIMTTTAWPVFSPFAREHYGRGKDDGRKEGRAEGRVEGHAEGRVEGRAEGRKEGHVAGEADAILKILAVRGIDVSEDAGARIRACTDQRQLDTWLERAVAATSVDDLFD